MKHGTTKHECEICDFITMHAVNLRRHMRRTHDKTPFPCSLCDYKAKNEHVLRMHRKKEHFENVEKIWLHCDVCDIYVGNSKWQTTPENPTILSLWL